MMRMTSSGWGLHPIAQDSSNNIMKDWGLIGERCSKVKAMKTARRIIMIDTSKEGLGHPLRKKGVKEEVGVEVMIVVITTSNRGRTLITGSKDSNLGKRVTLMTMIL